MKQLELHLGGEPPEHGELDAPLLSREVAARLGKRADGPLQIADDLPVVERRERDVPAGERVVALEIRLDIADAAEAQLIDAEAPCPHQRPGDIFGRVAAMTELPIEHVTEARRDDRKVADPQVTVEDDRFAPLRRSLPSPAEPELDRRVRVLEAVDLLREPAEDVACSDADQERHALRRDRVDLRKLFGHLRRQRGARTGELRPLHDPPPDRLARHALANECGSARDLAEVAIRLRDAHPRRGRDLQQAVLVLERERVLMDDAAAGPPHQELARPLRRAEVEGPSLLRRSAREVGESLDRDVSAEDRVEAVAPLDRNCRVAVRRPVAVCPPRPATEAMFMILPPPFAIMTFPAACEHKNAPVRFTSSTRRQSSTAMVATGATQARPALFTRMSIRPSSAFARSTIARTSSALVTSQRRPSARTPSAQSP